jgi:uncharacterized SAM-binding protein YcdF (DUF218 family)
MSTGDNQGLGVTNASVMVDYALRLGVPAQNLVAEDESLNTWQNLSCSMNIMMGRGVQQPTLVTLDLYTRRAIATARKQGWPDFYWLSVHSRGEPAHGKKAVQTYSRLTILLYEMGAMLYSRLVGWV